MPRELPLSTADGHRFQAQLFAAENPQASVFVICPAMGVRAKFYTALATELNAQGLNAVTFDLRGQGTSSLRASRAVNWGYQDMVGQDWPALVAAIKAELPGAPVYLLGHSLGGQLSALFLAAQPTAAQGLVLIASCSVYYRGWPFPQNLKILAQTQFIRSLALGFGFFPGDKVGFGGQEARQEIADWANNALHGRYEPAGAPLNYEAALAELTLPVWAFSLQHDDFAPEGAVGNLVGKMPKSRSRHLHLTEQEAPRDCLDHFGWAKTPQPVLAQVLKAMELA